ncbi:MAG TPA: HAMP domain-containing sensor histidine kinase [Blastocatellia bacterium]|nr:HAMP domain-containing sensor histidine kinase [Blastocatellia bacterium]
MNDLARLLVLPTRWKARELTDNIGSLLDTLLDMLPLDFIYARLNNPEDGVPIEATRIARDQRLTGQSLEIGRALESWLMRDTSASPQVMPNPVGEGEILIARFRVGAQEQGEIGVVVTGSQRADFPTKVETLILQVAANQAAIMLQREQCTRVEAEKSKDMIWLLQAVADTALQHLAHLYETERQARLEAEAANRAKDEFLATVSHELRAPLNAILGWTRLLRTGQMEESQEEHALEVVERNARSQNQLLNDLLDVSSIIAGNIRLNLCPVEIASVVEVAVEAVRPAAEAKGLLLQALFKVGDETVSGDSDRLQQIVSNLLSNAIKFTPQGGRIQVRLERVQTQMEIIVSDTGLGISPDFLPHVFERFRQADDSSTRRHGGLGLGLAIVFQLVKLHNGTVHADSAGEGQGAIFVVKLPLLTSRL